MSQKSGVASVRLDVHGAFLEAGRTVRLARDGINEIEDSIARGLRALGDVELGRGASGRPPNWEAVGDGLRELVRYSGKGVEAGLASQEYLAQARWSVSAARTKMEGLPAHSDREQSRVDGVGLHDRAEKLGRLITQASPAVGEATGALRRTGAMARTALERVDRLTSPDVETMSRTLLSSHAAGTNAQQGLNQASTALAHAVGHSGAMVAGSRALHEARQAQAGRGPEPAGGISW